MKILMTVCVAASLWVTGCGPAAGNSSVQRDEINQAAERIYPDVPGTEESSELIERGEKFFRQSGCESCHSTRDARMGLMGPPLGGVGTRVRQRQEGSELEARRWLIRHIKSPQLFPSPYTQDEQYSGTHMPPYNHFRDEDMRALVEFLWSLG